MLKCLQQVPGLEESLLVPLHCPSTFIYMCTHTHIYINVISYFCLHVNSLSHVVLRGTLPPSRGLRFPKKQAHHGNRCLWQQDVQVSRFTPQYLPVSPRVSPFVPVSLRVSPVCPCVSPCLSVSPPCVPVSPCVCEHV